MTGLRAATPDDIPLLDSLSPNGAEYFQRCFEAGHDVVIAVADGVDCGCAVLNYQPVYSLFRALDYPEIQDVAVAPAYRQRGIASALVRHCEDKARAAGHGGVGISVAVSRDFGPAQRLYIKLGYMPDGYGVTHAREPADALKAYAPDALCLMLVKEFAA